MRLSAMLERHDLLATLLQKSTLEELVLKVVSLARNSSMDRTKCEPKLRSVSATEFRTRQRKSKF
jgi:hypothetical protein